MKTRLFEHTVNNQCMLLDLMDSNALRYTFLLPLLSTPLNVRCVTVTDEFDAPGKFQRRSDAAYRSSADILDRHYLSPNLPPRLTAFD